MAPSLSHSLLLQSRWQLDRKRNRKGLKDLLLLSFSFKDKWPSDNFPQCSSHGGLCDLWLWESTGIWPTTTLTMGRRRRSLKKKTEKGLLFFSTSLLPAAWSLCFCGKHLGSFIPAQASLRTPVPSQVAGSERAPEWLLIVVVNERSSSLLTSLSGPSQSSHAPFPLLCQAPSPSQMPWSMVSVALHVNWKILNRFIQKLQWRQPALRFRGISWQRVKSVKLQINVSEYAWAWTLRVSHVYEVKICQMRQADTHYILSVCARRALILLKTAGEMIEKSIQPYCSIYNLPQSTPSQTSAQVNSLHSWIEAEWVWLVT